MTDARACMRCAGPGLRPLSESSSSQSRSAGDPALIERALLNLLTNVVRYADPTGEILVRAWASAEEVLIAVENPGPDIPDPQLARIFEPFFRPK